MFGPKPEDRRPGPERPTLPLPSPGPGAHDINYYSLREVLCCPSPAQNPSQHRWHNTIRKPKDRNSLQHILPDQDFVDEATKCVQFLWALLTYLNSTKLLPAQLGLEGAVPITALTVLKPPDI